jgi:multidrug efflux pump subunit AcrA (membrane-fusion protein)
LTTERNTLKRNLATAEEDVERLKASEAAAREAAERAKAEADERIAAAEERIREASAGNEGLSQQVEALIAENRRLAEQLEAAAADLEPFREVALGAEDALRKAREETRAQVRAEFARAEEQLRTDRRQLTAQVASLEQQVREQGKTVFVPPEKVADLVHELVGELRAGMPGMKLRDGEVKLKVGFAGVGEHAGFVVPTPDSGPEIADSLHEIVFRFDRGVELPPK